MSAPHDMHYDIVAQTFVEGGVVPFLGAGASIADRDPSADAWIFGAGLPNGYELAAFLADKTGFRTEEDEEHKGKEWKKEPRPPDATPTPPRRLDLAQVSQWIDAWRGDMILYNHLHALFASAYRPSSTHRFLARLAVVLPPDVRPRLFITTNYDDGMEQALTARGVVHDVVWYQVTTRQQTGGGFVHRAPGQPPIPVVLPDEYRGIDLDERPVVLKIHGAAHRDEPPEADSYVITEDNYIDYLGRADPWRQLPCDLRAEIGLKSFLFLGYGLRDWNLRVLLNRIWAERSRDLAHWAIQFKPSLLEEKLWIRRGNVELYDAPLRSYASCLERRIRDLLATEVPWRT